MVIHFGAEKNQKKTSLLLALPTFSCAHIELERAPVMLIAPVAHKPPQLNEQSRKM